MSKVSDTARNFIHQYSALTEFATALVAEGYDEEKNANLKSENEKLEKELGQKKYQLDQVTISVTKKQDELKLFDKNVSKAIYAADEKAALIIKDADEEASKRVMEAKQRVAAIKTQAAEEQDEASKRIADLNRQVADLEAYKKSLDASILVLKQKFS